MNQEEMSDEALKADESQIIEESPASEELPPENEGEEVEESESTDEEATDGAPEDEGRKTASSRIRELVAEKKEAEKVIEVEKQRADSLAEQMAKLTDGYRPQSMPQVQEFATGEEELTYEQVMQRADAIAQMRIAQSENLNRINNESIESIKAHPQLDPDSERFDKDLSESIAQATMAYVQSNPTGSVKKFVDGLMKPYQKAVEKQSAGQREQIARQVSEQATRPTQVQEQERPFSELSLEEMEEKLGKAWR